MRQLFNSISKSLTSTESWVIFFLLGIIMMNYPFITIFDKEVMVAGFPLLFAYLTGGWLVSIFVIYIFVQSSARETPSAHSKEQGKR
ncbi:MAG: hypothetical protein Fur0034_20900 [Desulfuromonadia bacterium]